MHELSLCRALETIVARAAGGRVVTEVEVDIGALRQVVPQTLTRCWSLVVAGTELADARLVTNLLPAIIRCADCVADTALADIPAMMCANCCGQNVRVVSGEEFLVRSIEVEEQRGAISST